MKNDTPIDILNWTSKQFLAEGISMRYMEDDYIFPIERIQKLCQLFEKPNYTLDILHTWVHGDSYLDNVDDDVLYKYKTFNELYISTI